IDLVLREGRRSFPGGSSLKRLLSEHRGVRYMQMEPDLGPGQIEACAEAHRAATGEWPSLKSGTISAASEESWALSTTRSSTAAAACPAARRWPASLPNPPPPTAGS